MIKQDYKGRDRRHVPTDDPRDMVEFTFKARQVARTMLIVAILVLSAALVVKALIVREAAAQTPQDGYDSLNMSPQGLYWQNRAQSYGEPAGSRYRPYGGRQSFDPGQPPTYYNEYGQPSTVPDPRQYYDVQEVQM